MGKKLQSHYQKSFVFISDHNFTIPSKEIRVYDYETGKVKILKTKVYKIQVEGAKKVINAPLVHTKIPIQTTGISTKSNEPWYDKLPSILALLFAFVLGVFLTLALKYLPKLVLPKMKFKNMNSKYEEALKVLYPKIGESKEVEEMVRRLYAVKRGEKIVEIDKSRLNELLEKYR
jgi:hypothetical protein